MGYITVVLFSVTTFLALIERYIRKYKLLLYFLISIALILIAGLRPVGIDPDSNNYEYTYIHYDTPTALEGVEYSYIFLSMIFNTITNNVHILFLFYALLGVGIKFFAFRKLSNSFFLPVIVYIGYYFIMHECMQIRTGILSAVFLLYIKAIGDRQKKRAIYLLLIGLLFHYSALLLLPFLFFSNEPLNKKGRLYWGAAILIAYIIAILGFAVLFSTELDIPYIGNKLALYQKAQEKGMADTSINIFSPLNFFSLLLYYYMMYFYDTLRKENIYFTIMMKVLTFGIVFHVLFSFFPVLAVRGYMLYSTVTIILYSNIVSTIKPKWAGIILVALIAFIFFNYAIPNIGTYLFWKDS